MFGIAKRQFHMDACDITGKDESIYARAQPCFQASHFLHETYATENLWVMPRLEISWFAIGAQYTVSFFMAIALPGKTTQ
ncbi:MAG: hypothetical protein ACXU7H_05865 [Burkholderiaceae bacterium]